jgi:hypothetical protein
LDVCADQARGIHRLATEGLAVPHHFDLFHEQHESSKVFARPMGRRLRVAEAAVQDAKDARVQLGLEKQAAHEGPARRGRPKNWAQHEERAHAVIDQAEKNLSEEQSIQQQCRAQVRSVSEAVHPVDPRTGAWRTGQAVRALLGKTVDELAVLAMELGCEPRMAPVLKRLTRASEGFGAHVEAFAARAKLAVGGLQVAETVRSLVFEVLIPYAYVVQCLRRSERGSERELLRQTLASLRGKLLEREGVWCTLSTPVRAQLWRFADRIARTFVRSSSMTEGRNGWTSLRQHQRHRLTDADLRALRVVHNFVVERADGTTAAQRLFGQRPRSLFAHLCRVIPVPGPPRHGHPSPRREDHVAPILVAV